MRCKQWHQQKPRIGIDLCFWFLLCFVRFQLSVEMFDYLDAILDLQLESKSLYNYFRHHISQLLKNFVSILVFKTLDSTRCNSMTNAGQCRLKPLIACIQDSILLYDYTTKILFHLHASMLPTIYFILLHN